MTGQEWSAEGRAWVTLLMPIITWLIGWHQPQPSWGKKKSEDEK